MRMKKILIDFDKTISPIHGFSVSPTQETIDSINTLHKTHIICIFSCRANRYICDKIDYINMVKYLNDHKISYDEIISDKPLYAAIIDDRAFNPCRESWSSILDAIYSEGI